MNGHLVKYRFYKETGKSEITIPRAIVEVTNLNWENQDNIYIITEEINGHKGLFLFKKEE